MKNKLAFLILWMLTVICFIIGITIPAFIMTITLGSFWADALAGGLLGGGFGATELSIIHSIKKLLSAGDPGNIVLGVLILLFSVIFPALKYSLLMIAFIRSREDKWTKRILKYGYWSMLDVFVVAVLVVAFKGFPGGSKITPATGIYFFAASVILSNLTHKLLEKNLKHEKIT